MLWTDEHAPAEPACIVGNTKPAADLITFLAAWARRPTGLPPIIMLHGPPGVGKSASIAVAARKLGFELVELNSSMQRTYDTLERTLSGYMRLDGGFIPRPLEAEDEMNDRPTLVALEEVDGLDRGGMQYLYQFFASTTVPVVLTCNLEVRDPKMRTLAGKCTHKIEFTLPGEHDVVNVLLSILATRAGRALSAAERSIAQNAYNGSTRDPRNAINRLQLLCTNKSITCPESIARTEDDVTARSNNLFECGRMLFQGQLSLDQSVVELASDSFLYSNTVWDNYPRQCGDMDLDKMARASEAMSTSDTLEGNSKYGHHGNDPLRLITGPITAAYHTRRAQPARCEFPSVLAHLSHVSKITRSLKGIAQRIRTVNNVYDENGTVVKRQRDIGHPYDHLDIAKDLAKNICLCTCRLAMADRLDAACDILIHYSLDMDDLDTLRTASSWLDPLTGMKLRPALSDETRKMLGARFKELRPPIVKHTFTEEVIALVEGDQEVMADVEVTVPDEPKEATKPKQPKTARPKQSKKKPQ